MESRGYTERVRQELAVRPLGSLEEVRAELAAIVRFAGVLRLSGGRAAVEVVTPSGPVARRTFALLVAAEGVRPEVRVRVPGGLQRHRTFRLGLGAEARRVATALGVLDPEGRPTTDLRVPRRRAEVLAMTRGALLACAAISGPGHAPHLEFTVAGEEAAHGLAALVDRAIGGGAQLVAGTRYRVVVKSGARIGELLAAAGATAAFLEFDDRRLRRQLRGDANRLANADGANLRRSVEASSVQLAAVERVVAELGWEGLADPLRAVALARLANPEASLAELGALVDPPVSKSAVHRRLRRLEELAGDLRDRGDAP